MRRVPSLNQQPQVSVGIVSARSIKFSLNKPYVVGDSILFGEQVVEFRSGMLQWNGGRYAKLTFIPQSTSASFSLHDVTIGIGFHWERNETQTFSGTLMFVIDGGKVCAINYLPIETYLESVISSEMSATASLELLKAHAVISRSWLLSQIKRRKNVTRKSTTPVHQISWDGELTRWYESDSHYFFDVCADDHCQRYQGITKETSPNARKAVWETFGQILTYDNLICDARFSKCCGGMTEEFQYCWDNTPKPYLKAVGDDYDWFMDFSRPDLRKEDEADKWIRSTPQSFCDTHDKQVLSQVLNDYDQETTNFYRWRVEYTQGELSDLISAKMGMPFGKIIDLIPIERGESGRIYKLKIVGTGRTLTIGKELEIRKALSKTHLYSSAFVVDKGGIVEGVPGHFILIGAGWGHGVGLCQIGAAVMGELGYTYDEILSHYYKDTDIIQIYDE